MSEVWFLDRDGVINRKAPEGRYVTSWQDFEFLPGALDALRRLSRRRSRVVVVTNQRGVALGHMTMEDIAAIHRAMTAAIRDAGGDLEAVYVCPHDFYSCDCRKPKTGLFERAQGELRGIDFHRSLVVGDSASDIEAGQRIGARTILVGSVPNLAVTGDRSNREPDHIAPSLSDAVQRFVGQIRR